ncbi:DUF4389 domain-containing protein [Baekduia sp. Peel2402]|uniref:DUF4389 domain-containing protein n=1 Tax=Baekduia sp. Peel2402 TaxID=3458296 RepID=UPI00403E6AE5
MIDQPTFDADYVEKRSRLSTFFRFLLIIPHLIVVSVWGFIAFFAVVLAWFAIVFTGRYPEGLYSFVAGLNRYATAMYGYFYLLTDEYPPFGPDTDNYPVRIGLSPEPKAEYDRIKTLLRIFLIIPPYIIAYAMGVVAQVGAFLSWIVIVITGKQPKGLQDMIVLGLSYQQRVMPYYCLLTETWPSFTTPEGGSLGGPSNASGLPPAPVTAPAPAAPEAPGGSVAPPPSSAPPRDGGFTGGDPLNG